MCVSASGKFGVVALVYVLLQHPLFADTFENTGTGTINTSDSSTRVGIGVTENTDIPDEQSGSKLVVGSVDIAEDAVEGGQIQINAPNTEGAKAAFLDNYISGELHLLRFLNGDNTGAVGMLAFMDLDNGDFAVAGKLIAHGVKIYSPYNVYNWSLEVPESSPPDYVFDPKYKLKSLEEIDRYVRTNRHLPEMPSADQFIREGMDLTEMNFQLLKKVEELTLHAIKLEKRIKSLEKKVKKK